MKNSAKAMVASIGLLFSISTSAMTSETINLDIELKMAGKAIASPKISIPVGQKMLLRQNRNKPNETFMEVIATRAGDSDGIKVDMVVGKVINGRKRILSTPAISAIAGEQARISVYEEGAPKNEIAISVLPSFL